MKAFSCWRLGVILISFQITLYTVRIGCAEESSQDSKADSSTRSGKCRFDPKFVDRKNIKVIQKEIGQCNQRFSGSCREAKYSKYRTIDGSCNNLKYPSWGKANSCHKRILPYDYGQNGLWYPRMSNSGNMLPNPRSVSIAFHRELKFVYEQFTTHMMEWGQIIAHDASGNPIFRTKESGYNFVSDCCSEGPVYNETCISSVPPPEDTFYNDLGLPCINWIRSIPCDCKDHRSHLNRNTAYLDLSLVYGSNKTTARNLRSMTRGMMRVEYSKLSGATLPTAAVVENCVSSEENKGCYVAGDERTNQTPFLVAVHTYLLRYHNFIAFNLKQINRHWDDETLYQESRRINIAIYQFITYGLYLKHILGKDMTSGAKLDVRPGTKYTTYDPTVDAGVTDEFAAFAQRYGHTLIPGNLTVADPETGRTLNTIRLRDHYYVPNAFQNGQFDKIVKGMTCDRPMRHDEFLSDDVRNFLYRRVNLNDPAGDDLAAVSVMRGRDHGIPGHTYYLKHFFNIKVNTFDDFKPLITQENIEKLKNIYECVHDVDIYVSGLAEAHVKGGIVGITFAEVLRDQFKRLKFGDRYYFEHGGQAGSFTQNQLREIKRMSLAGILCDVSKIKTIQRDPFLLPSHSNPNVSCDDIPRINFNAWEDYSNWYSGII